MTSVALPSSVSQRPLRKGKSFIERFHCSVGWATGDGQSTDELSLPSKLLSGSVAATTAQTIVFPLDTLRRRLQARRISCSFPPGSPRALR